MILGLLVILAILTTHAGAAWYLISHGHAQLFVAYEEEAKNSFIISFALTLLMVLPAAFQNLAPDRALGCTLVVMWILVFTFTRNTLRGHAIGD